MGHGLIDLTGLPFTKLRVICQGPTHRTPSGSKITMWWCSCVCRNIVLVSSTKLRTKHTKSCGCSTNHFISMSNRTHGLSKTRTWTVWNQMIQRCTNPKASNYEYYGGRGISVCQPWLDSFESFYADMGECAPTLSIERKDVNGNYEASNCRWATKIEQMRNHRRNRVLTVLGITGCIAALAEHFKIDSAVVHARLRANWDTDRAFTYPVRLLRERAAKPAPYEPTQ